MPGSKHGIPHPPPSGAPSPKGEGFGRPIPLPSPLGEGVTRSVTDEVSGQRPPAAGLGPAPTRKMGPSLYPCRGGCPHPPAVPPEPHLSPPAQKARSQPVEIPPKGYRQLSGSGNRPNQSTVHPRLCEDCQGRLIGGPRKMGVQGADSISNTANGFDLWPPLGGSLVPFCPCRRNSPRRAKFRALFNPQTPRRSLRSWT